MMEGEEFRLKKTGASHVDDQASLSAGVAWESPRARSKSWPGHPIEPQQRQEDQKFNLGFWPFAPSGSSFAEFTLHV